VLKNDSKGEKEWSTCYDLNNPKASPTISVITKVEVRKKMREGKGEEDAAEHQRSKKPGGSRDEITSSRRGIRPDQPKANDWSLTVIPTCHNRRKEIAKGVVDADNDRGGCE